MFLPFRVLIRAANDVPLLLQAVSAVSATVRPPWPLVLTLASVALVQLVPPLQVTSAVKSVLSVIEPAGLISSSTRPLPTLASAVCAVVTTVMLGMIGFL